MFANPVHSGSGSRPSKLSGFRITLVVKDLAVLSEDTYKEVKVYCEIHKIIFTGREYSSIVYSEDCDNIRHLPAFHIYKDDQWLTTVYNTKDINPKIQSEIALWEKKQEQIRLKREAWQRRFNLVSSFFGIKKKVNYTSR
uniref:Thioredoxin domain-containing protein n=1 Tax=viral metagenome TaxID=1070528 RepID=A0A6C0IC97_9ZZZZ